MIPEGWVENEISSIVTNLQAGVSVNSEDRPKKSDELGVLKVSAVTYGFFDPAEHKAVLPSEVNRLTVYPQQNTILVSRANTLQLIGASAYVDQDHPSLFLPDKLWMLSVTEQASARWLSYVLSSDSVRTEISNRATGTSGSMKNIPQDAFLSIRILLPPLPEQRKIAAILSTWDEAITLTERLIAALKARKQALMQLLLTGKVRFPGFDGEWREIQIGEVAASVDRNETVDPSKEYRLLGVRWYVEGAHIHEVRQGSEIVTSTLNRIQAGDIVYNKMWVSKAAFSIARPAHDGAYGTSEYPTFRADPTKLVVDFIGYLFHDPAFQYQATSLCRGTTGRIRLNPDDFLKIPIRLPGVSEQSKIADTLTACDDHIQAYSDYLEDLKDQKRGLMQQLLTGAIRVQVEE